ncbi:hypothetical protein SODALDRAFT_333617 [Sodiomyces alkalinus F11]|uniref:CENP-V/GFA domain-containing protein n=1 Tax=Sodiomyces alkalinus (strain CBS 110278 / VKM F-3762 / F11) TaxID=1314773 RepID=A0A3N2PTM7_SODAK|nr:hypothetical protein SODALDRAFT_333617 [Sodiomyces alkalinus F11]ROT37860.1 hypothetical protein SODALDRAFT_333617 [Sodiomyces alkalinus F11]
MDISCQCGAVTFRTATPSPLSVYFCHCTQCRRQSSSAFGISAVFPASALPVFPDSGASYSPDLRARLDVFTRPGNAGRTLDCYFCRSCGARVVHRGRAPDGSPLPTANIKGGLIEGLDLKGASHIWTREAVVPIPDGAVSWPESPPA